MADVFLSYAGDSGRARAEQIARHLEETGISCWYADRDIPPGVDMFAGFMTRAIRECRVFLLILNQEAARSAYVQSESALALRRILNYENLTLLAFRVDDVDTRADDFRLYDLPRFQIVDGCAPDALRKLGSQIARIVGPKRAATGPQQGISL